MGSIDDRGRLWLLGRVGSCNDARGKLYPLAMETALSFCPEIQRSAFFAVEGERILALQLGSHSQPDLTVFAALFDKMSVDKIWEVAHIPTDKRHNAKIDYVSLARSPRRKEYKIHERLFR